MADLTSVATWRGFVFVAVDWFNNRRLLEPTGNIPPLEYELANYHSLETPARVARLR